VVTTFEAAFPMAPRHETDPPPAQPGVAAPSVATAIDIAIRALHLYLRMLPSSLDG
jgi:hypothetical protein